jgi:hypothetical protein
VKGAGVRESGIHQLYLVANSLQCVKASGDRINRISSASAGAGTGPRASSNGAIASQSTQNAASQPSNAIISGNKRSADAAGLHDTQGVDDDHAASTGIGRPSLVAFSQAELMQVRNIALFQLNASVSGSTSDYGGSTCYGGDDTQIAEMSCVGLLTASLCPTIFGHELVKLGLLLGLFGGTRSGDTVTIDSSSGGSGSGSSYDGNIKGLHVRSDIHVLVVGDPGLGKVIE